MITITVRLDEKRSTTSQYENKTCGVQIEQSGLELQSGDAILQKIRALAALATAAVNTQFHDDTPVTPPGRGIHRDDDIDEQRANGNGGIDRWNNRSGGNGRHSGGTGNGNGHRSYGRPDPEPTPKQRQLLARISRDRHLGPEQFGEICSRLIGKPLNAMDRRDVSRLIEALLEGEAA